MRLTARRRDRVLSRSVAILAFGLAFASTDARATDGPVIPRFASIRAGEANLRTGPGVRYPIEWVFVHPDLPVEIVAEYQVWRKVRDFEGSEGWMHQSMLSKRRSIIVTGTAQSMRREPAVEAPLVAKVEPRVVGRLLACADSWCRVEIAGRKGWMPRGALWGVRPDETLK